MFGFLQKKKLLSDADNDRIVEAIQATERRTSGEIRVYIESRNPLVSTLERAQAIFFQMQMHHTRQRNAVLLYVAIEDKEVAILGDEGIHQQVGTDFWNQQVAQMVTLFQENSVTDGMVRCVTEVGNVLVEKFPFMEGTDQNELSDSIVFGK